MSHRSYAWRRYAWRSRYGGWGWAKMLTVWPIATVLVVALIVVGIRAAINYDAHRSEDLCYQWGRNTGYEVKFERPKFTQYDCFARVSEGRWLPIDQLREVEN